MTWHRRFFWLFIVFLPTQLGVHFWPEWAHVLGRRVDYLSPTLYLTDILLVLTVLSYTISNLKFLISNQIPKILLAILFATVNILVATNPMVAIYKWVKVGEFVALGWYIVRTKPATSFIIHHLSFGILFSSLLAIAQFILQHSVGGPLWWLGERTFTITTPGIARAVWQGREILRPYATFPHPNVLGGYIAAILPLVIIQLSNYQIIKLSNAKKIFYITTFILSVIALLLTFSRSAIAVGIVAIVVTIARMKKYELRIMGIVLLVFILTSYVLRPTSTEESIVVRQQLNEAALKLWQTSPLFGVGLGNFLVRLPEVLPTRTIYFLQPVHNIYLLLLSEIGVVGVVGVVWLMIKALSVKQKSFPLRLALYAFLLLGLVDHYPLTLQQGQLLLTLLVAMSLR